MTARSRRWRSGLAMVAAVLVLMAACAADEIRDRIGDFWFDLRDWRGTGRPRVVIWREEVPFPPPPAGMDAGGQAVLRTDHMPVPWQEVEHSPRPARGTWCDAGPAGGEASFVLDGREPGEFHLVGASPAQCPGCQGLPGGIAGTGMLAGPGLELEYQPGGEGSLAVTESDRARWREECEAADAYTASLPDEPVDAFFGGSAYAPGYGVPDLAADPCGAPGPAVPRKAGQ